MGLPQSDSPPAHEGRAPAPVRVMIVDDSVVVRALLVKWMEEEDGISVVASCADGRAALRKAAAEKPDVVVLDIEMPVMNGIEALPLLLELDPEMRIVMASALTERGAAISLEALSLGAADYLPKPQAKMGSAAAADFRRSLVGKVRALGSARSRHARAQKKTLPLAESRTAEGGAMPVCCPAAQPGSKAVGVIAIGCSTGGPTALAALLGSLSGRTTLPMLISQHMPKTFTPIFADSLSRSTGMEVHEARDGEPVLEGRVYLAPGDFHMLLERQDDSVLIRLDDGPPEHFCRPAVDPMFRSVAEVYGGTALAVVLTGMGRDGCDGAAAIAGRGGTVYAQDEATSVVWGMPGAVAAANIASAVLPLEQIGPAIIDTVTSNRP